MVITDRFHHIIDSKNRLAIPSPFRNAMNPESDGVAFYLVPEGRYLQLIPEKHFERLAASSPAGLSISPEDAKARRLIFSNAARLEPDKNGRVIIPDRFMADTKNRDDIAEVVVGRDVTLVAANDRIELWNRLDFLSHMRELQADRLSLQPAIQRLFGDAPDGAPAELIEKVYTPQDAADQSQDATSIFRPHDAAAKMSHDATRV